LKKKVTMAINYQQAIQTGILIDELSEQLNGPLENEEIEILNSLFCNILFTLINEENK